MAERVSAKHLGELVRTAEWLASEGKGLLTAHKLALDLRDARATIDAAGERITELEQALASSQTASQHFYNQLTANNEVASKRIAELEAALAEARKDEERLDLCTDPSKYYVYSVRDAKAGFAGGSVVWWRADGHGYSRDLKGAGVYTVADYLKGYPHPSLCIYVPCNVAVDAAFKSETLVWEKHLPTRKALAKVIKQAAIDAAKGDPNG